MKVKLFISYCHADTNNIEKDDNYISEFFSLINSAKSYAWSDNDLLVSKNLSDIKDELKDSDICCIFVSDNYLNSESCMDELKLSFSLLNSKNMNIFPIILNECDWKSKFSDIKVAPYEGKPLNSYENFDQPWNYIFDNLTKIINSKYIIKNLSLTNKFSTFLDEADVFSKAHDKKETVLLDDIFVYPDFKLLKYDNQIDILNSKDLIDNLLNYPKFILSGETQSGKTTLCKIFFKEFKQLNFVPVYLNDKKNYKKDIKKLIKSSITEQYENINMATIDIENDIVPIIDNFHLASNGNRIIKDLSNFKRAIFITDDIYNLSFEKTLKSFPRFLIQEFKHSSRLELVKKWLQINEGVNDNYDNLDHTFKWIENILGKDIGNGMVPSYPFFIISAMINLKTFHPLDQKITSQSYYYQILIYYFLHKKGVKPEDYDIYLNFLTEISFYIYNFKNDSNSISSKDFQNFVQDYNKEYFPIDLDIISNLKFIFSHNTMKEYSFNKDYFYYYFIAKYFAENILDDLSIKTKVNDMINNLHVDKNAYIIIFISYHMKGDYLLDLLYNVSIDFFKDYHAVKLTKDEVSFFDKKTKLLVEKTIDNHDPDSERIKRAKIKDKEESQKNNKSSFKNKRSELRRSIKTVEVIGCILKNRYGALKKDQMIKTFKEGMFVHLRMMDSYFNIIRDKTNQNILISQISEFIEEKIDSKLTEKDLNKFSTRLFWNWNFILVNLIINKIIKSLGSEHLKLISQEIYNELQTPSTFLVNIGIWMWYDKCILLEDIDKEINKKGFSEISKKLIFQMIHDYCLLHQIHIREIKRIEDKLSFKIINKPKKSRK